MVDEVGSVVYRESLASGEVNDEMNEDWNICRPPLETNKKKRKEKRSNNKHKGG